MSIETFTDRPVSYGDIGKKWKATLKDKGTNYESIQLRKTINSSSLLIIVGLAGWKFKGEQTTKPDRNQYWVTDTTELNVRFSSNGTFRGTFADFEEISQVVQEAKEILEETNTTARDARLTLQYGT